MGKSNTRWDRCWQVPQLQGTTSVFYLKVLLSSPGWTLLPILRVPECLRYPQLSRLMLATLLGVKRPTIRLIWSIFAKSIFAKTLLKNPQRTVSINQVAISCPFKFFRISNICTLFTKPYYLLKSCFATKYVVQYSREKLLGNPLANWKIFSKKEIKFQITICLNIIYLCIYEISSTIHHFNFQVSFQHGLEH